MSRLPNPDIDIDVKDRNEVLKHFKHVPSSERILEDGTVVLHKSGVHFDDIPVDPLSGYSSVPYKTAEELGYQKIDFLNVSAYDHVKDRDHLEELLQRPVPWELFKVPEIVGELFQLKNQYSVVSIWPPTSVEELAMLIAMIRPAKRHLVQCSSWDEVRKEIWTASSDGKMGFKHSHSISYALLIVVQLNALVEYLNS